MLFQKFLFIRNKFFNMETNILISGKQENTIELSIIQRIHEIRGAKVILDFDLAERQGFLNRLLDVI